MSEAIKELKEKLLYKRVKTYEVMTEADFAASDNYAKGYMAFLDGGKTERECVDYTIKMVEAQGYRNYKLGDKIEVGGKYYYNNRGRAIYVFRIGTESVEEGIRISAKETLYSSINRILSLSRVKGLRSSSSPRNQMSLIIFFAIA